MAVKKNKSMFFLGAISSVVVAAALLGITFFSYRMSLRVIDKLVAKPKQQQANSGVSLPSYFMLDFESSKDAEAFDTQNAGAKRVKENASSGNYSLEVEFPAAQQYPAILFEYYGTQCLDWSGMKEFSFDAYNSIDGDGELIVQIRSGKEYPKREFKQSYTLPARAWTKVVITKEELERNIDLDKVSRLAIFMANPITTYMVNFDRIGVIKDEKK